MAGADPGAGGEAGRVPGAAFTSSCPSRSVLGLLRAAAAPHGFIPAFVRFA